MVLEGAEREGEKERGREEVGKGKGEREKVRGGGDKMEIGVGRFAFILSVSCDDIMTRTTKSICGMRWCERRYAKEVYRMVLDIVFYAESMRPALRGCLARLESLPG